MEAARDFIPFGDDGQGTDRNTDRGRWSGVDVALAALEAVGSTAVQDAALWDFRAASDFAGGVEELSRRVEFLQLVAAGAVDRTRKQSAAAAARTAAAGAGTSWTTGWRDEAPRTAAASGASFGAVSDGTDGGIDGVPGSAASPDALSGEGVPLDVAGDAAVVDDGYRNTAEFLRARLRIGATEAKRRLSLAGGLLPRRGLTGQPVPAAHGELGAAVAAGEVASRAATIIAAALEKVRHVCDAGALARMEHALTRTAAEHDADFLVRVARGWADALDQDGAEPSEELLRQLQGAFIRRRRHGLHHLEIFATTEQFEYLLTVMNTGTNPRTGTTGTPAAGTAVEGSAAGASSEGPAAGAASDGWAAGAETAAGRGWAVDATDAEATPVSAGWAAEPAGTAFAVGWAPSATDGEWPVTNAGAGVLACDAQAPGNHAVPDDAPAAAGQPVFAEDPGTAGLDQRSRAQRLLDGLVGACEVALATGGLPAAGGLRPQVMVTIDYRDLLARLGTTTDGTAAGGAGAAGG
ncbi:protein of unknown function, partial [Arthrobacter sp. ok909]|uniref:DUF222 domain-containing protein n=1 Tax=Arthrobacter sp. ok909 TaxID=1761746 RepID=UPI00088B6125